MESVEIEDSDNILRRVRSDWIKTDGIPSSQNFKHDEVSCHLERLADLAKIMRDYPDMRLARLNVGEIRAKGLGDVRHDPTLQDRSHCVIVKATSTYGKLNRAQRLAGIAKLL